MFRTLVVAAGCQEEKESWLEDLYEAVQNARERNDGKTLQYLSLKSCSEYLLLKTEQQCSEIISFCLHQSVLTKSYE